MPCSICSALYVVDLVKFRETAAGDNLRVFYETLSKDPNSLSNLDQASCIIWFSILRAVTFLWWSHYRFTLFERLLHLTLTIHHALNL